MAILLAMSEAATAARDHTSSDTRTRDELIEDNCELQAQLRQLQHQFDLLQRMLFGPKTERHLPSNPYQMMLGEVLEAQPTDLPAPPKQTITYERGKAPKVRPEDCVSDSGLRFDASVPVKTVELPAPEIAGLSAEQYEIIDVKVTHRLAQRPASYVVLHYERPVIKLIETQAIVSTSAPSSDIMIVCSNWAESDLSRVRTVQPSLLSVTAYRTPTLIIGSMVKQTPGCSRSCRAWRLG